MHAYTVTRSTPTERKLRFEHLQSFTYPNGVTIHVRSAHWERRGGLFPFRLWLRDRNGHKYLTDPLGDLPDWLAATAPDWADRAPKAVR